MEKYTLNDAIKAIQTETGNTVSQADVAKALEVSVMAVNKRVNNNSEIKVSEVHILQDYFNCKILKHLGFNLPDAVEILPYHNPEYEHLILNPKVESIWNDKQITRDVWEEDEKVLRYLSMPGNSMDGGTAPIPNGTPLIIDTASTDILCSGVFAYITNAGYFVNKIKVRADGKVEFIHTNPSVENREYTQEELDEMGFKVIGRLIHTMNKYRG